MLQQLCGWADIVGGNCKCRVSLRDEVASALLNWAVLKHKKRLRGTANYRPKFLDIFVISSSILHGCTQLKCSPQRNSTASWQPPQLSGLCHCDSHSGAALGLVVDQALLASTSHTYGQGLYLSWENDYRTLVLAALC